MANEKTTQILDLVKGLTILELADLVKALEEEFGVSATPVAVAGPAVADAAPVEEKTEQEEETPAPSPITNPLLSLSNGILALSLLLELDNAFIFSNPAIPISHIEASVPPAITTSS